MDLTKLLLWTGATGFGIGLPAILLGFALPASPLRGRIWPLYALPFAMGASMGTAQRIVLRRHFNDTRYWIPATTVGGGLGFLLGGAMTAFLMFAYGLGAAIASWESSTSPLESLPVWVLLWLMLPLIVIGAIIGLIVGFSQWLALRRFVSDSSSWILFTWAGFALMPALLVVGSYLEMLSVPNDQIAQFSPSLLLWIPGALGAFILPGLVTGFGLLGFLSDQAHGRDALDHSAS